MTSDTAALVALRRSWRDVLADTLCVLVAIAGGALYLLIVMENMRVPMSPAVVAVDAVAGLLSSLLLWWRRRWPVGVVLALLVPGVFFASVTGAIAVAVFTVAVHRTTRTAALLAALNMAVASIYFIRRPPLVEPLWRQLLEALVTFSALVAWGMFVRARRQLLASLRDRADRAEADQRLRADRARAAERARIAREMHDVLAHRVSLVALHAGALELRPDLPAAEVAQTAGLIRATARQALEELREVIGVLREEPAPHEPPGSPAAPQPTLGDIPRLVEDSRRAGSMVELRWRVDDLDGAPGGLGRDAYRIVQESLTNVHKHALGTATLVEVTGGPGRGLQVTVRNRLPLEAARATLPGAGAGLAGIAERVAVSGGTLSHGPTADGDFVVAAGLRWPT